MRKGKRKRGRIQKEFHCVAVNNHPGGTLCKVGWKMQDLLAHYSYIGTIMLRVTGDHKLWKATIENKGVSLQQVSIILVQDIIHE